jgi:CTP:molybdopterin cytidylyltransferase MocA
VTRNVVGVVLAAGEGRRFGGPKALAGFEGKTLLEHAVCVLEDGGCRPVLVVLGASADEVLEKCALTDAVVIVNEEWSKGMGGSLRLALAEARRRNDEAVLVLPVDQPAVTPALVERLLSAWHGGAVAAVASYGGEGRTPVVIDGSLWHRVEESAVGDQGARELLRSNPELVTLVPCDDVGDPSDIDTPGDLPKLTEAYRRLTENGA